MRLTEALGTDALVDAAAVVANFNAIDRIADATGIPIDGTRRVDGGPPGGTRHQRFCGRPPVAAGPSITGRSIKSIPCAPRRAGEHHGNVSNAGGDPGELERKEG